MEEGHLPISIFRPGGIYGPGDLRFLKLFRGIKHRRFIMIGSGKTRYQPIYIDDLVDGILLCGEKPEALGNIYILTGAQSVTLNELARLVAMAVGAAPPRLHIPLWPVYMVSHLCELLCKPFGIQPPLYRRRIDFFRKTRVFSIAKAQQELGFSPKVSLAAGLKQTADWYQTQGLL
jgi:nucleoside-diphosphate-sugar epimerase